MKLEVQSVRAGYGKKLVLDGIDFTVPDGSITTLLGPNGCGKSTLLKVIGRIIKPDSGTVLLNDKPLKEYRTGELAKVMAILPQLQQVSSELTVEELVAFGRFPHRKIRLMSSEYDRKVIDEALRMTRMEPLRKRRVSTLSGGERQRAWVGMTLAQEPKVLLLDEPTTFLDICCQFEIIEMVRTLNRKYGMTVVMVLHDLNLAARYSDRLILMKDRKIRYSGLPQEIMTAEILRDIFEIEPEINLGKDGMPYCLPIGSTRTQ